ncbi:sister chromatid cohesion protein PDS5 homolog C-like isoform X3 [Vicia villosa]|uniref:sister chromatid cohesion protein PDS5 homolog C-like isoform X3 n=1 Tax=Vicia villosa TaxID=3911 RepID=UPI00273B7BAA|nr:sister chromatid cohesion protein PDS5 homolog C-like isoform X3 [Vicia villosa]
MGSVDKEVEEELLKAGEKLLDPPSSIDDLINLLDKIESCLSKVEQSPSESMHNALSPALKALVADKLIKHSDVDVKVALASCFSEITRITAPDAPYDDEQMKEVFRLIVSSFENLHDKSSQWQLKRTLILETVAKVRSCVVMLDLECDALILEMFQHFFKTIREHHPDNVFSSMETIMVLCLEESEDISLDLLSPILESVKKDNEEVLPIARKLGERVLESCATRLKPYLVQAVNTLGISLDDYSDVLASLCNDSSDNSAQNDLKPYLVLAVNTLGNFLDDYSDVLASLCHDSSDNSAQNDVHDRKSAEEPVEESAQVDSEITKEATPPQQDNDADGDRSPKSVMSNGIAQAGEDDSLVESKPLKKQDGTDSPGLSKGNNLPVNEERNDLDTEIIDSKEQKLERSTKRKGKKASSSKSTKPSKKSNVVSEKEAEKTFDSKSPSKEIPSSLNEDGIVEATGTSENDKEIKATISSPKVGDTESDAVVFHSPSESNHDENRSKKRVRTKKKNSSVKEVTAGHISKKVSEGTCDSEVKSSRPSAKKGLDRSSDVKVTTVVDAVKKGSGKSEERTKGDGGSSSRKPEAKKKGSVKTEERTKVDGESSLRKPEDKKKKGHVKGSSEKGLAKSSSKDEDKVISSLKSAAKTTKDEHSEVTPKTNLKRKRTPGKEKVSGIKKNDQKLVGKRVKVWWPEDETFYEGVVYSFDSSTKKHKVLYDDEEEEILNLEKEKWEIIEADAVPDVQEEGSHQASPDPSTDMPLKKKGKTNAGESKKEGKKDSSSKSGGATSSKSKTPSIKSTQKSKTVGKSDSEVGKKSKDSAQKTGGKFEDRSVKSGGQSEERSVKSGGKSIDSTQKNNSKKSDGSKIKKYKDDDVDTPKPSGSKIKKSKDDAVDTLKHSANSKQETVKTGKSKQGTSKIVEDDDVDTPMPSANSKQETVKTGKSKHGTSKIASSSKPKSTKSTAGKVKFSLAEDSENENSEDSTEEVEDTKVKTPSSLKAGSVVKSGKKRARN